jgi:hypothetical protein
MVRAVILSSLMAACVALCLILVLRLRRAHGSNDRHDGFGGIRQTPTAPTPTLPAAGAALATARPIVVPAERPAQLTAPLTDLPPAAAAARNRARNNGFARFGDPGATARCRGSATARR